jgi:hypothetical protein
MRKAKCPTMRDHYWYNRGVLDSWCDLIRGILVGCVLGFLVARFVL